MIDVTDRQLEIFQFVERFLAEKGYPPTRQEIADEFDFNSANAAEQHLRALEKKGAIRLVSGVNGARGISRGIVLLARSTPPRTQRQRRPGRK